MNRIGLAGQRFIALVRCSSAGQVDTSIDAQVKLIQDFAVAQGIVHVDTVVLGGVTGSIPGLRTDIDQLITRKRGCNDFDVVLVQDSSRFTRSGPAHGLALEYELREVGVDVIFVSEDLPAGDMGDVMRGLHYFAAKQQAKSIAFAGTRGQSASLAQGKTAHCKSPPFGIDRLYCAEDGTPKHVIRNLHDGTQVKLHPDTGEIIERFGRNEKSGVPAHYIKQKSERIVLVPGDQSDVAVVRDIFRMHFVDGLGYFAIAKQLNDRGVATTRGGSWHVNTVRTVLINPVYCGLGIANVQSSAIYYMRGQNGPIAANAATKDLAKGRPPNRIRNRDEWVERAEPRLDDLLDVSIKAVAEQKQRTRLDNLATRQPAPKDRDKHRDSEYVLKGILISKQGNHPMTGRLAGRKGKQKRYYAVGRAFSVPDKNSVLRRMIPAEPIERAVLLLLQQSLADSKEVRARTVAIARQQLSKLQDGESELQKLAIERTRLRKKLDFIINDLDELGRDAMKDRCAQLTSQLRELENQIRGLDQSRESKLDPEEIADAVCRQLADLSNGLPDLPVTSLRRVLAAFVSRLVVDLETRQVEIEIAIPKWANPAAMCLDANSICKSGNEAHHTQGLVLAVHQLRWNRKLFDYRPDRAGIAA